MSLIEKPERLRLRNGEQPAVGEIMVNSRELMEDPSGRIYERVMATVGDESYPEVREKFARKAESFERQLQDHPEWEATSIDLETGQLKVDPRNLAARDLYYDEHGNETQMSEWGTQMMQAIALEPLQRLGNGGRYLPGGSLDRRTLELFTNMPDGIGLRSRQHIYANLLVGKAEGVFDRSIEIISLGSGASVPNIEAAQKIAESTKTHINWQLFDIDQNALRSAELLIKEAGLDNSTFDYGPPNPDTEKAADLPYAGRSYIEARQVENESIDVVDALGLWEYLKENQAAMFLKMMYPKLRKGGSMIVSNMKIDRPQPLYNQRAVGWPGLYMREESDMLDIVEKAGIPTGQVTFTHPSDNVYMVMEVRK